MLMATLALISFRRHCSPPARTRELRKFEPTVHGANCSTWLVVRAAFGWRRFHRSIDSIQASTTCSNPAQAPRCSASLGTVWGSGACTSRWSRKSDRVSVFADQGRYSSSIRTIPGTPPVSGGCVFGHFLHHREGWATGSPWQRKRSALRRKFSDGGRGAVGSPEKWGGGESSDPRSPATRMPLVVGLFCGGSARRVPAPRHKRSRPACQECKASTQLPMSCVRRRDRIRRMRHDQ